MMLILTVQARDLDSFTYRNESWELEKSKFTVVLILVLEREKTVNHAFKELISQ